MISVEASQRVEADDDTFTETKPKLPSRTSSWDPDQFQNQAPQWKESSKKNVTRLQDVPPPGSDHEKASEEQNESWPYESSPCVMFGGKNTRKGGEDVNKELFDPDFPNHQNENDFSLDDSTTEESFCGDDGEEEEYLTLQRTDRPIASVTPSGSSSTWSQKNKSSRRGLEGSRDRRRSMTDAQQIDRNSRRSSKDDNEEITKDSGRPPRDRRSSLGAVPTRAPSNSYNSMLAWNQNNDSFASSDDGSGCSAERTSGRGTSEQLSRHSDRSRLLPQPSYSEPQRVESMARSCHPNIESKKKFGKRRPKKDDLPSATYHCGPVSQARAGPSRKVPDRNFSTDGSEMYTSTRKRCEELGTVSMHGTSTVSRVRSGRRAKGDRPSGGREAPERRKLNRGMSTDNVRPPEEYSKVATGAVVNAAQPRASGRRRMIQERIDSKRNLVREESKRSVVKADPKRKETKADTSSEEQQPNSKSSSSQRNSMKDSSSHHHRRGSQQGNTLQDSSSHHRRRGSQQGNTLQDSSSHHRRRGSQQGNSLLDSSSQHRKRGSQLEPSRDLVVLLKEQQTVQKSDLMDKDNRRLLHFLIYEHQMGVSLKELHKSIRKEREIEAESMSRRRLSLEKV